MANVTFRELTRAVGETDQTGQTTREERVWETGVEIEGVFVRTGTVTEGQLEDARNRAAVERERGTGPQQQQEQEQQSQQTSDQQAPNEETPASQASTSSNAG